jgi:virulence-associated protein VagC
MDAKRLQKYQQRLYSRTPLIGERRWRKAAQALVQDGSPKAAQALAEAIVHSDEQARGVMLEALWQLADRGCIDAVCAVWATTRHTALTTLLTRRAWVASSPVNVKVLSALQAGRLEVATRGGTEVIEPLVRACEDISPTIAERARTCLLGLQNANAIDALCARWAKDRQALLTQVIEQAGYTARQPLEVRVLTALQVERVEVVTTGGSEVVEPLLQACEDADSTIAARAR